VFDRGTDPTLMVRYVERGFMSVRKHWITSSLVTRYMCAINIYHRAVVRWLGRFDAGVSAEERFRRHKRMERAERICRNLRAQLGTDNSNALEQTR